jgi:hypothetical protein
MTSAINTLYIGSTARHIFAQWMRDESQLLAITVDHSPSD